MSFEEQLRLALDGAAASLRQHLDADLRTFSDDVARAAADERDRAAAAAAEAATAAATAEVRAQADAQIAQYRDAAQKHADHLKQLAESQVGEMRKALEDLRAQAQQQLESARRIAHEEIGKARAEVDKAQADVESARSEAVKARTDADKAQVDAYRARGESDEARADVQKAQGEVQKAQRDVEQAHAEVDKARDETAGARDDAEKARVEVEQARAALQAALADVEKARGEIAAGLAAAAAARQETNSVREESERAIRGVKAEAQAAAQAEAERIKAEAEEMAGKLRAASEEKVAKVRIEGEQALEKRRVEHEQAFENLRVEHEQAFEKRRVDGEQALEQLRVQGEHALQQLRADTSDEIARLHAEMETTRKAAAGEAEDVMVARLTAADAATERKVAGAVERVHTDGHQSELSRAARLADAIRTLDEARGLSEVLERLAQCAGHEVDRAAVLLVKGDRATGWHLAGWRLAGFGTTAPAAKSIDLSVDDAGLAGAVVESGVAASRPADASDDQPSLPPFARGAGQRHAMALPVRVGGDVVAVLYADAPRLDRPSSDARWPAVVEVLVRHASRVLEAMTVQQAAGLSLPRPLARGSRTAVPGPIEHEGIGDEDTARRYARLLLSEIRMYHEPIVDAGRRSRDLMARLGGEIDRARRLYEARVPSSVPSRSEYFDQELVRTLADGDRTLLGGA